MIMDELGEFADAVAIATATGTANFGDIIDLGTGSATDPGHGETVYLVVTIDTAVTSAGAATVAFKIVSDATTTISTTTASVHYTSAAIGKASLTAGAQVLCVPLPDGGLVPYERYLAVQTVVGTAALTAGKANAFLTKDPRRLAYPADATN